MYMYMHVTVAVL